MIHSPICKLPVEMLWKILLEAAVAKTVEYSNLEIQRNVVRDQSDNRDTVRLKANCKTSNTTRAYRDLAAVCRLWKAVLDEDLFRQDFQMRLIELC